MSGAPHGGCRGNASCSCMRCRRIVAMGREGAFEPCAWFTWLGSSYEPGDGRRGKVPRYATMCARCGHVKSRDARERPCIGRVRVELR